MTYIFHDSIGNSDSCSSSSSSQQQLATTTPMATTTTPKIRDAKGRVIVELNDRRRARYQNDPEFRDRIRAFAQKRYVRSTIDCGKCKARVRISELGVGSDFSGYVCVICSKKKEHLNNGDNKNQ